MKYVAAYLLAQLGGNKSPSSNDIQKILSSVGIEVDSGRVESLLGEVSGKSVDELFAAGQSKLASMPAGGAAPAAAAGNAPAAAAKAQEKAAEPESESDEEMGMGLFD